MYSGSLNPRINLLSLITKKGLFINFPSFSNSSIILLFVKSCISTSIDLKLLPLVLNIFLISDENCTKASSKKFFEGGSFVISIKW